jgi:hypothetical protein
MGPMATATAKENSSSWSVQVSQRHCVEIPSASRSGNRLANSRNARGLQLAEIFKCFTRELLLRTPCSSVSTASEEGRHPPELFTTTSTTRMIKPANDAGDDLGRLVGQLSDVYFDSSSRSVLLGRGLPIVTVLWRPRLHPSVHGWTEQKVLQAFAVVA